MTLGTGPQHVCTLCVSGLMSPFHRRQVPQQISEAWRPFADPQLPAVFTGGWVGYCGYDTVRYGYLGELQAPGWLDTAAQNPAVLLGRQFSTDKCLWNTLCMAA